MPHDVDEHQKYDADFWRGLLEEADHIDGSKLILLMARQKIDQWCALYGGLTPIELRALLEDVKGVITQGRERQGPPPRSPTRRPRRPHLRVIK